MTDSIDDIQENHPLPDEEIEENRGVSFMALVIWKALLEWDFENFITPRSVRKNLGLTPKVQKEALRNFLRLGFWFITAPRFIRTGSKTG